MNRSWLCVIIVLLFGCATVPSAQTPQASQAQLPEGVQSDPSLENAQPSSPSTRYINGCEGTGKVVFTASPMALEDIQAIAPLGLIIPPGHITPIDHQYYYPKTWQRELKKEDLVDIYAPASGVVTSLDSMPAFFSSGADVGLGDYRFVIHHSCTFYTIYIHVRELSPKLQALVDKRPFKPVKVAAGELIGRSVSFDFSAHDEEVTLTGFIVPAHYEREPWKIHTVDPYDYFTPELKSQLMEKNMRTAEPRGGKIDYDIDGKLIGNWFVKDTNGYQGVKDPNYYDSHLAFAPDAYDTSHYIIGLGADSGMTGAFGSDGPNPKDVDVSSGIVTYKLMNFEYSGSSGAHWDRVSFMSPLHAKNEPHFEGILLAQLLDARTLKIETFKGSASGFTDKAVIYER